MASLEPLTTLKSIAKVLDQASAQEAVWAWFNQYFGCVKRARSGERRLPGGRNDREVWRLGGKRGVIAVVNDARGRIVRQGKGENSVHFPYAALVSSDP